MGLWSKIKKGLKKAWKAVKSFVRQVVRVVVEVISRVIGIFDLLLGFLGWPPKKLRLHVFILCDEKGVPVMAPADLDTSLQFVKKTFKDRFNVNVKAYSRSFVEVIKEPAPTAALDVSCDAGAWGEEFGEAGDFFAKHLAGWNGVPINLGFPITAFIVRDVDGKIGCSLGPLTDYVTIDPGELSLNTTMAHEIGHACGLWHSGSKSNLMYKDDTRGNKVKGWQKNLFRSSRHVTYW